MEETGVQADELEQLHTFGEPGRDPRGRTISVVYLALVDARDIKPHAADDAADVGWHSLARPPELAFDHGQILDCARQRLKQKEA
jgi:8-oxo-dGTP diphosphatase